MKKRGKVGILFLVFISFLIVSISGASGMIYEDKVFDINNARENYVLSPEGTYQISTEGIPKSKGYIIQFKDEPVLVRKVNLEKRIEQLEKQAEEATPVIGFFPNILRRFVISSYNSDLNKLEDYKADIKKKHQAVISKFEGKVMNEFSNVFNGVALNITQEEAEELKKNKEVKEVYPNLEVNALLMDSVPLINADDVWNLQDDLGRSITGQGIKIAIIDTGVDYTHPDLGGCFGAGCKVEGGYDVVNNDNDPMDDYGHGTHVAGTAAGNGDWDRDGVIEEGEGLNGVAPDAKIYAYKVLSSGGSGTVGGVIAGIERAVDPNQDGNFDDKADVISMSLGVSCGVYYWGCGPDDYLSQASDNAVNAGVIVVIAAGNSGPREGTIASPGTARRAITVGASDKQDVIASFSSRGPVDIGYEIIEKPDVVAPGVSICAAQWDNWLDYLHCLDERHISISGTSMATPHVAGVAALLKQAHPDWNPEEIKQAIKYTAINIGYDVNTQGYGRVDALRATEFSPSLILKINTGGEVKGIINIIGTASGTEFDHYVLYYGRGENPSSWEEIVSSGTPVRNDILYSGFDTSLLDEGINYLRLIVWNRNGETIEDISGININNIDIKSPLDNSNYRIGDVINIFGDLIGNFDNFRVEYGVGENPVEWFSDGITLTNEGIGEIRDWIIASWDTSFISQEGYYTLRITVNYPDGRSVIEYVRRIYFFRYGDSPGWPKKLQRGNEEPLVADINGDGQLEVIWAGGIEGSGSSPHLFVWDNEGNILGNNWPIMLEGYLGISIADINNDKKDDIVVVYRMGPFNVLFDVFDWNGNSIINGPRRIDRQQINVKNPVVSDLDNDGNKEIIMLTSDPGILDINSHISVFDLNSNNLVTSEVLTYSQTPPVVGDFNGDGNKEIAVFSGNVFSRSSKVYMFNKQLQLLPNFPIAYRSVEFGSHIVAADIDDDGQDELIYTNDVYFPEQDLVKEMLYVLNGDGSYLPPFNPLVLYESALQGPLPVGQSFLSISDINEDGKIEIIIAHRDYGQLYPRSENEIIIINNDGSIYARKDLNNVPVSQINIADYPGLGELGLVSEQETIDKAFPLKFYDSLVSEYKELSLFTLSGGRLGVGDEGKSNFLIKDIDSNEKLDIVFTYSSDWNPSTYTYLSRTLDVYRDVLSTDITKSEWPQFQHDPQHTGLYIKLIEPISIFNLNLHEGWNLVSVPLLVEDNRRESIFPSSLVETVWEYQNPGGWVVPSFIVPKKGYWVKARQDADITIYGTIEENDEVQINTGWNLIGVIGNQNVPTESFVEEIKEYLPPYQTPTTLFNGRGYWVKASQNGVLFTGEPIGLGEYYGPSTGGLCGNNIREGLEDCDGLDDSYCPGECLANCTCLGIPEIPIPITNITCTDSDNGLNYYVKGDTRRCVGSNCSSQIDSCVSNLTLKEYYCNNTAIASLNYNCVRGCSNGACIQEANVTTCTDSDNGKNEFVKGIVTGIDVYGEFIDYTDSCYDSSVFEGYCFYGRAGTGRNCSIGGCAVSERINCVYGCSNGICLNQTINQTCTDGDNGKDYFVKGIVTDKTGRNYADLCYASLSRIFEYYCKGDGYAGGEWYNCTIGCSNGACSKSEGITGATIRIFENIRKVFDKLF